MLVELVGGEATFAVEGKRSRAMHKVWIRLDSRQSACGCRAYLQEGTCGHCDAAARQLFTWAWFARNRLQQLQRAATLRSSARG